MNRLNLCPLLRLNRLCMLALVLACSFTAIAQTSPATPALTPAQQRAQAARAARQAAAQQAAQNRAAAAQNRAAAAQNKSAANGGRTNTAAAGATSPASAYSTSPTRASSTLPRSSASNGSSTLPSNSRSTGSTGSIGTVGSGTLDWETRVYSSTGCVHNGNSAVCTFTFVNQGNEANLVAGRELGGIQLVDDAHFPHAANAAHFQDKYGTQQARLIVQPGDTGTYVVTFPNVNSQVTSGDFHLRQQIVGGVTFNAAASTPKTSAGLPSN